MFEGGASRPRFFRGLTGNSFQVFTRSNQNPLGADNSNRPLG